MIDFLWSWLYIGVLQGTFPLDLGKLINILPMNTLRITHETVTMTTRGRQGHMDKPDYNKDNVLIFFY